MLMDSNGFLWVSIGLYLSLWTLKSPNGSVWVLMPPYETLCVLFDPYRSLCIFMGCLGLFF